MGFKYGLWLIYDNDEMSRDHIPHIIIANFLEKNNAEKLFIELVEKNGLYTKATINGKPDYFYSSDYDDKNKLCAWGYNGLCSDWKKYEKISRKYDCIFHEKVFASVEYGIFPKCFHPIGTEKKELNCQLCMVDMRSDFPVDWKIIL